MKRKVFSIITATLLLLTLTACGYKGTRKVSFMVDNEIIESHEYVKGDSVPFPTVSVSEGYEFDGWYFSGTNIKVLEEDFSKTKTTIKTVLVARFNFVNYTITYNSNIEGLEFTSTNPETYTIEDEIVLADPVAFGYEFLGWTYYDTDTPTKNITIKKGSLGNITLTANFKIGTYRITFNSDGGSNCDAITQDYKTSISLPIPTKLGYEFGGWYYDDGKGTKKFDLTTMPGENTNLKAKWAIKEYTISFTDNIFESIKYTVNDSITIKNPTKEHYVFDGWTSSAITTPIKDLVISKGSTGSITLTANFSPVKFKVEFSGTSIPEQLVDYNQKVVKPTDPEKTGDTFLGWYTNASLNEEFDFENTRILADTVIFAKWFNSNLYKLTIIDSEYVTSNYATGSNILDGTIVELKTDYYIYGYKFSGWYVDTKLVSREANYSFAMPANDFTISPIYEAITTYTYDLASSNNLNVTIDSSLPNHVLFGNDIAITDYSISSSTLTINSSYLSELPIGLYAYLYGFEQYIYIKVIQSDSKPKNVRVDYDINYPNATLLFEENDGCSYEYKINTGEYQACVSGQTFEIDKSKANTISVRCNGLETSVTTKAYTTTTKDFFEKSFDYGAGVHDYYVESREDLRTILAYAFFVLHSTDGLSSTPIEFYSDYLTNANIGDELDAVQTLLSIPYDVSYSYSINLDGIVSLYVKSSRKFNSIESSQEKTYLTNSLTASSRSESFDSFKINDFTATQQIRSLYELEDLEYRIKPIFNSSRESQYAKAVYDKAKAVLRKYVDDSMSDYEKVRIIYDWLAINVTYDDVTLHNYDMLASSSYSAAFTSYGALILNKAVCDGIASAFKIMCLIEGIDCDEVTGCTVVNSEGHAWNKVTIDGVTYGVDATWSRYKNGSGIPIGFYHKFLLIDEYELCNLGSGHVEGTHEPVLNKINVIDTANGLYNYYEMTLMNGEDLIASSLLEVKNLSDYAKSIGLDEIEIRLVDVDPASIQSALVSYYGSSLVSDVIFVKLK